MFIPRRHFASFGMLVMALCCVAPVAADPAVQAGITVNAEHCQTDLEKTICTLAARLDALRDYGPYWDGPFETDPTCDAVLLVLADKLGKSQATLRRETLERIFTWKGRTPDGWATYPGGPYDHNNTAIILLALQAIGLGRDHPELAEAWQAFDRQGSLEKLTVTSRMFLDALGLHPNTTAPWLSPKIVAFSKVSPVNIFKLGILRSIIVPQIGLKYYTTLAKAQPVHKALLKERGHLFGQGLSLQGMEQTGTSLFFASKNGSDPLSDLSNEFLDAMVLNSNEFWAQEILAWTLKAQQADGTWYALASTINSILLLQEAQAKGVADFSAEIDAAWHGLMQARRKSHQGTLFVQTIRSTIWDTANALSALLNVSKRLLRQPQDTWHHTVAWMLRSQSQPKDMPLLPGQAIPKAWSFSHLDAEYLDADDTAASLNALLEIQGMQPSAHVASAIASAVAWLLPLQNDDGGFPSWNRGMTKSFLKLMGSNFKDLVEVADVSQTDVTARVLYVLTRLRQENMVPEYNAALATAMTDSCAFLQRSAIVLPGQSPPVWFGDWAINYVYATSFATMSLLHARCWTPYEAFPSIQWIMQTQQQNGGWGESPESYKSRTYVPATPTIFQTSAALLALIEYYERDQETPGRRQSVRRAIEQGVQYLLTKTHFGHETQEDTYTAVAVKGQMFVQYYYAPYYFTLYTLARWHKLQAG